MSTKHILMASILAISAPAAQAWEYAFDWEAIAQAANIEFPIKATKTYVEHEVPSEGINLFIEYSGGAAPRINATNGSKSYSAVEPMFDGRPVYVARSNAETIERTFYMFHFDEQHLYDIRVYDPTRPTETSNPAAVQDSDNRNNFFTFYGGNQNLAVVTDYHVEINTTYANPVFYVQMIDASGNVDNSTNVYIYPKLPWISDPEADWHYNQSTNVGTATLDGETWRTFTITQDARSNVLNYVFFSLERAEGSTASAHYGDNLANGNYYLRYYPYAADKADRLVEVKDPEVDTHVSYDDFKVYSLEVTGEREISFTTTGEHGTATLTLTCRTAEDLAQVDVVNGELQFPKHAVVTVTADDGTGVREVWLGKPAQGNHYSFTGVAEATREDLRDMEPLTGDDGQPYDYLWLGGHDDHLYMFSTNASTVVLGEQIVPNSNDFNPCYYIPNGARVYTEGTTLHELLNAECNVRLMNHAFADDLVAVAVKGVGATQCLVCRSLNPLPTPVTDKPSYKGPDGQVYAWSNPATPQYDWILLSIDNPEQYVTGTHTGKILRGVRGLYSRYVENDDGNNGWTFWLTPFMAVAGTPEVVGEASTTLNTYMIANFIEHGDDKYYMMEPQLAELCNVVDIMRTNDQRIYVPDKNAIMPEGVDGEPVENISVELGIGYGYASLYQQTFYDMWRESDRVWLVENGFYKEEQVTDEATGETTTVRVPMPGQEWRMKDKVYDCPDALVLASQHSNDDEYVYPLDTPGLPRMQTAYNNVMHIIGQAQLRTYETEMWLGNADYWSRYEYAKDCNAYRNDLRIGIYNPAGKSAMKLTLKRYDMADNYLADVAIVDVATADDAVNGIYTITSLPASLEAQDDEKIAAINADRAPHIYNGERKDAKSLDLELSDMFYSVPLTAESDSHNGIRYKLVDAEGEAHSVVDVVPVYEAKHYYITRGKYTLDQVEADTDGSLEEDDEYVDVEFDIARGHKIDGWTVERDDDHHFMANQEEIDVDYNDFVDGERAHEHENCSISHPEQHEYVPVLETVYNDNTYGTYKKRVTDASVTATVDELELSTVGNLNYYNAQVDLSSMLDNMDRDSRYLLRVWRVVDGERTLLNGTDEFQNTTEGRTIVDYTYNGVKVNTGWATNYSILTPGNSGSIVEQMDKFQEALGDQYATGRPVRLVDSFSAPKKAEAQAGGPRRVEMKAAPNEIAYEAALYVENEGTTLVYVKHTANAPTDTEQVITGVTDITEQAVAAVRYVNVAGQESSTPFDGVNIVVTTHADGSVSTSKFVK